MNKQFNLEKEVQSIKDMITISLFIVLAFLALIGFKLGMGDEWGIISGVISVCVIILGVQGIAKDIIQRRKDKKKLESNS